MYMYVYVYVYVYVYYRMAAEKERGKARNYTLMLSQHLRTLQIHIVSDIT